jgi:CheY-like chemotaxis protein
MGLPKVVLFIDDDAEDIDILCQATGVIDNTIVRMQANNGVEAIKLLSQKDALLPDLIFLDINMPLMNGKECFVALKKLDHLRHIPIIMCSTSKYEVDHEECKALGADFYLVKPDTLIQTVNSLIYVFSNYSPKLETTVTPKVA